MSGIDGIKVAVAYNCTPKPEFVNDNVWILKTVQQHHSENIKHLMEKVEQLEVTVSKGEMCQIFWIFYCVFQDSLAAHLGHGLRLDVIGDSINYNFNLRKIVRRPGQT